MNSYLYNQSTDAHYLVSESGIERVDALAEGESSQIYLFGTTCNVVSVPMPLKQEKQIVKALPFALEEVIGSELEDTHIKYINRIDNNAYSLITSKTQIQKLYDNLEIEAVGFLPNTLPLKQEGASVFIIDGTANVKISNHYFYSVPCSMLEKSLHEQLTQNPGIKTISVYELSDEVGQNELLLSQLEGLDADIIKTGAQEVIDSINSQSIKSFNLLCNEFKRIKPKTSAKTSKFKLPLSLVAASLLIVFFSISIETSRLESQAKAVQTASVDFYKKLFPGERVRPRLMKRQFNDYIKEAGAGLSGNTGFTSLLANTAVETQAFKNIDFESIKFNSKSKSLEINLTCESVNQLDKLKDKLTNKGLFVDIASANQSGKKVKGVIKVSNNG